jgi:putative ABC transport system permease protein
MRIPPAVAENWPKVRIGALCDERTAREQGWRVNDTLSLQLITGQTTRSGERHLQIILLGTYSTDSILSGLLVSTEYLTNAFPQTNRIFNIFVRPERPGEGRQLAQRIDEHFRSGVEPTFSAVVSDYRESSAKDASTMRLVLRGSLAISFFTMVLMVANALMQSVRERLGELAVMQALGFSLRTVLVLVLAEALALFAAGAMVGLILANVAVAYEIAGIRSVFDSLPSHTLAMAVVYVVLCASIAAAIPCWELSQLRVSDALRRL